MTYSIDAARAQRAEANGEPFDFEYRGEKYTLPREFSLDMTEAVGDLPARDSIPGLRVLLTALLAEQAERFPVGSMTGEDLLGLFDAYFEHTGIRLGESETSPSSSQSTARPSKQTSKRSTASTSRTTTAAASRRGASKR